MYCEIWAWDHDPAEIAAWTPADWSPPFYLLVGAWKSLVGIHPFTVRLMIVFNVDFSTYGADPQAGYAIIRPDGTCPACTALAGVLQ